MPGRGDGQTTIVVANKKGGVGKTTMSDEIAFALERRGRSTAYVSVDPQRGSVHASAAESWKDASYVVVDTHGGFGDGSEDVIAMADVVVVPLLPSRKNLDSTIESLALVERLNPDARVFILINQYDGREATSRRFVELFQTRHDVLDKPTFVVARRAAFKNAEDHECSAHDLLPSATEPIEALVDCIEMVAAGRATRDIVAAAVATRWYLRKDGE